MYQPATLQLGPSDPEGTWTTGLQYPPVSAHVSDRLVQACSACYMSLETLWLAPCVERSALLSCYA